MIGSDQPVTFGVDGTEKLEWPATTWSSSASRALRAGPIGLCRPVRGWSRWSHRHREPAGGVRLDQRYPVANPDEDDFPALMSGVNRGPASQSVRCGIRRQGGGLTRTWYQDDEVHFQAMVPPELVAGGGSPEISLVRGARANAG